MTQYQNIQILDTSLRDGEQTQGVGFTPAEKANIAKALLGSLKVDRLEVASAKVSEGEREGVAGINRWAEEQGLAERVEVLGFVDYDKSVDWIKSAGGRVINLLTKGSLKHCKGQLKKEPQQHWADVVLTIEYAKSQGLTVNVYLEDWSNGYQDSPDYVYDMMEILKDQPIEHVMLPDTLGVMSPDQVYASLTDMVNRFPGCNFDFHPHNDYGMATANAIQAVRAGVKTIHCTINCLGERAGNASLAEVAVNLKDRLGVKLNLDESQLFTLSRMVENFSGKRVADNTPIVGGNVFTQTAGIHADGDQKGGLYKSKLRPERFGRKHSYALGKMSGKASLAKNLEELDLNLSEENQKKVLKRIIELGDSKTEITTEDLHFIVADVLESNLQNRIQLEECAISSSLKVKSSASICLKVDKKEIKTVGEGNGGYDAFMDALKKALKAPLAKELGLSLNFPTLEDYEVRIPKGGKTSALTEAVITWRDKKKTFRTRGIHHNQVYAAINATMRMVNMQLGRGEE